MRFLVLLFAVSCVPVFGDSVSASISPGPSCPPNGSSCYLHVGNSYAEASAGENYNDEHYFPTGATISGAGATGVLGESVYTYTNYDPPFPRTGSLPQALAYASVDWAPGSLMVTGASGDGTLVLDFAYDAFAVDDCGPCAPNGYGPLLKVMAGVASSQVGLNGTSLSTTQLSVPIMFGAGNPFAFTISLSAPFPLSAVGADETDEEYGDFELTGFSILDANGNALPNADLTLSPEPATWALFALASFLLLIPRGFQTHLSRRSRRSLDPGRSGGVRELSN